jgi:hypothetical protein
MGDMSNSEERQYSLPDEIRDLVEGAAARPASEILLEAADRLEAAEQKIDLMRGWVEEQARGADQEHARAVAAESALAEARERDKEKAEWRESIARAWKRTDAAESALAEAREAWKELRPFVRRRPDRLDAALAARPGEQKPPCMGARDERCHPEPGMCACFDRPVT